MKYGVFYRDARGHVQAYGYYDTPRQAEEARGLAMIRVTRSGPVYIETVMAPR